MEVNATDVPLVPWTRAECVAHIKDENAKGDAFRNSRCRAFLAGPRVDVPEIVRLRAEGKTQRAIARDLGIARSTVIKYTRQQGKLAA